jgi:hypothetical protein
LQIAHQVSLVTEDRRFAQFIDQRFEALLRFTDGLEETPIGLKEARNGCVIKPGGTARALSSAEGMKALEGIVLHGRHGHHVRDFGFNP